ncbi:MULTISPECIES: helix-turn-helix transcriptional regulator [unclassified Acinetobacter]|jgi:transcriptional regulator with XRE-family HTH domain|uniref:helix-turn-helix transcriptional regulator n=1 Tax=unclassified Acinetobacter TaxID=196816 RepID=UPI000A32FA3B|nr:MULTISPECIES: helix-turn-helix transcriptional regulator [unclassified Acinetobacter]MDD2945325.1 helix-turn-helix transcriptional regulator [Acinetobacter sp.]OTG70789.1 transcriptional regulator [Acinetobacter sp. ANC 4218]
MTQHNSKTAHALAIELGQRLQRARLNLNLTQLEVAQHTGVSRKVVMNAEAGQVTLENLIAILMTLDLVDHLDLFLPEQLISPIQLWKLRGKIRQRASRKSKETLQRKRVEDLGW